MSSPVAPAGAAARKVALIEGPGRRLGSRWAHSVVNRATSGTVTRVFLALPR